MGFYDSFFSNVGPTKLGVWQQMRTWKHILSIAASYHPLNEETVVVEVGPGRGILADMLHEQTGCTYVALEGSPTGARELQAKGFTVLEGMVPPFPPETPHADCVIAFNVIEHMPGVQQAVEFVQEAFRVLNPGGILLVNTPNILEWSNMFYCDYTHRMPFTPAALRGILTDNGFELLRCVEHNGPLFGPSRHVLRLLRWLIPWSFLIGITTGQAEAGHLHKARLSMLGNITAVARRPQTENATTHAI